jgi:hypothetical protein
MAPAAGEYSQRRTKHTEMLRGKTPIITIGRRLYTIGQCNSNGLSQEHRNVRLSLLKGTMVDLPLAVAEGLRIAPRLYGEQIQDYGTLTDWKSGFVVAGKVSCR